MTITLAWWIIPLALIVVPALWMGWYCERCEGHDLTPMLAFISIGAGLTIFAREIARWLVAR